MIKIHWLIVFSSWDIGQYVFIIYFPVCDVASFKINLSFLIKRFSYMTNMSGQKCKYFKHETTFSDKIIFHHF